MVIKQRQEQEMDKAAIRAELEVAMADFLARGGVVEIVKARKNPRQVMRGKSARGTSFNAIMDANLRTSKVRNTGEVNNHKNKRVSVDVFA
jgi:hypothetical protein